MALVLDASVIAEYLLGSELGRSAATMLGRYAGELHIPHLAVIETASVLRAWARKGEIGLQRIDAALSDLQDFPARRWPGDFLLARIWELRGNVTAYDGCYVALSEFLEASLLTADSRLRRGIEGSARCPVIVLGSSG